MFVGSKTRKQVAIYAKSVSLKSHKQSKEANVRNLNLKYDKEVQIFIRLETAGGRSASGLRVHQLLDKIANCLKFEVQNEEYELRRPGGSCGALECDGPKSSRRETLGEQEYTSERADLGNRKISIVGGHRPPDLSHFVSCGWATRSSCCARGKVSPEPYDQACQQCLLRS